MTFTSEVISGSPTTSIGDFSPIFSNAAPISPTHLITGPPITLTRCPITFDTMSDPSNAFPVSAAISEVNNAPSSSARRLLFHQRVISFFRNGSLTTPKIDENPTPSTVLQPYQRISGFHQCISDDLNEYPAISTDLPRFSSKQVRFHRRIFPSEFTTTARDRSKDRWIGENIMVDPLSRPSHPIASGYVRRTN